MLPNDVIAHSRHLVRLHPGDSSHTPHLAIPADAEADNSNERRPSDDEGDAAEEERDEKWRMERHEREKWLQENAQKVCGEGLWFGGDVSAATVHTNLVYFCQRSNSDRAELEMYRLKIA